MRFGHNLHRHVVPEWHGHYVDYNLLKRLAKPPLDGVKLYDELEATLDKLEAFFELRFEMVDIANQELCKLFDLNPGADLIPDAAQVCPFELTLLFEAFHEFRQDLRRLHWFHRVNAEAVGRIVHKLRRREQAREPAFRSVYSRWEVLQTVWHGSLSDRLSKYDGLIADAAESLQDTRRTAGKSPYLARCRRGREHLEPLVSTVTEAVQRGDFRSAMEVLTAEKTSKYAIYDGYLEGVQALGSELFRYAAMLRPAEATPSLMFDQPSYGGLLVSHETLKWATLAMGRRQKLDSSPQPVPYRQHHDKAGFEHLMNMLDSCEKGALLRALASKDRLGRLPMHYAAMYGVTGLRQFLGEPELKSLEWRDVQGLTPIHHAVVANHSQTVSELAEILGDESYERPGDAVKIARELLPIALANEMKNSDPGVSNDLPVLESMVAAGKPALPVVQREHNGLTSILVDWLSGDVQKGYLELADRRGWTPLFHACALGQYDIVRRLLELGGNQTRTDNLGWTAQEHAALNGHLHVADLFETSELRDATDGPARAPGKTLVHPQLHCAEGERVIVASLGSERVNDVVTEVSLPYCSSPFNPATYDGFTYALKVSAPGTTAQPIRVRLPILDDQINEPFVFPIPATVAPQLVFKVIRHGYGTDSQDVEVGSGTALLEGNTKQFGAGRQSLIREQTIPILEKETMGAVGTVTFTFMVANHFPHLQTRREVDVSRKQVASPVLIGHRGLGMNLKTQKYLQIGENTVESFLSASKLGASYVEFDFQVTKDHEGVIFHDFSLSQSGTDVPVHDVTLDQFMYAGNIQSPHGNPLSILGPVHARDDHTSEKRRRSRSVGGHFEAGALQIRDRMKHTVDYRVRGFKANTRGAFIQDSFATLKELLLQVPEHVGFDIEIKYPRLHEAQDAGVAPVAIELNTFVDVALQTLAQHAGSRPVILSSFTPEICILLSLKQKAYPVFFITNAGKAPMIDFERRAASVQVATRFAQRWNLAGVVFFCESLLLAPRLVGYVKRRGLVCATYGTQNNVPGCVRRQVESGVEVIIADRVRLVAETLDGGAVLN